MPDALRLVGQLAGALDFAAAAGIHHGALHPRDILVAPREVRMTGIGVAQALESAGGRTPLRRPYSAPERAERGEWGAAADIFSLAAIAYELLTGRRPALDGDGVKADPEVVAAADKVALAELFARSFSPRADDRHPSALAFAAGLKHALTGQPIDAAGEPLRSRSRRGGRSGAARRGAPVLPLEQEAATVSSAEASPLPPVESQPGPVEVAGASGAVAAVPEPQPSPPQPPAPIESVAPATVAEPEPPLAQQPPARQPESVPESVPAPVPAPELPPLPDLELLHDRPPAVEPDLPAPAPMALDDFDIAPRDREPSLDLEPRPSREPSLDLEARPRFEPSLDVEPEPSREPISEPPLPPSLGVTTREPSAEPAAAPSVDLGTQLAEAPAEAAPHARPPFAGEAPPLRRALGAPPPRRRMSGAVLLLMLVAAVALGLLAGYYFALRRAPAGRSATAPAASPTPIPAEPIVPVPSDGAAGGQAAGNQAGAAARLSQPTPPGAAVAAPSEAGAPPASEARSRVAEPSPKSAGRKATAAPGGARAARTRAGSSRAASPRGAAAAERTRAPIFQGGLAVVSKPSGARVLVDGHFAGTTPLTLSAVPAGSHVVRLERDGYQPWSSGIQVVAGQKNRVTASLEQRPAHAR